MSNFKLSYLQKVGGGGIFVQAIPQPKKVGGGGIHPPSPPPRIYASDVIITIIADVAWLASVQLQPSVILTPDSHSDRVPPTTKGRVPNNEMNGS